MSGAVGIPHTAGAVPLIPGYDGRDYRDVPQYELMWVPIAKDAGQSSFFPSIAAAINMGYIPYTPPSDMSQVMPYSPYSYPYPMYYRNLGLAPYQLNPYNYGGFMDSRYNWMSPNPALHGAPSYPRLPGYSETGLRAPGQNPVVGTRAEQGAEAAKPKTPAAAASGSPLPEAVGNNSTTDTSNQGDLESVRNEQILGEQVWGEAPNSMSNPISILDVEDDFESGVDSDNCSSVMIKVENTSVAADTDFRLMMGTPASNPAVQSDSSSILSQNAGVSPVVEEIHTYTPGIVLTGNGMKPKVTTRSGRRVRPRKKMNKVSSSTIESSQESTVKRPHKKVAKTPKGHYECEVCKRVYNFISQLKIHEKKHAVRKCSWCEMTFTDREELLCHQRENHKRPKAKSQLKCNVCSLVFKRKADLADHRPVHNADGKYLCSKCPMKFWHWQSRRAHVKICYAADNLNHLSITSSPPEPNTSAVQAVEI